MSNHNLKLGDKVRIVTLDTLKKMYDDTRGGFPIHLTKDMYQYADTIQEVTNLNAGCTVPAVKLDCCDWSWDVRSLIKVEKEVMFKESDKVVRTRRFTESFVEGEVHEVQRVSDDGQYIWVGGYRGKTPARYFKAIGEKPFKKDDVIKYKSDHVELQHIVAECKLIRGEWSVLKADNLGQGFVKAEDYELVEASKESEGTTLPEGGLTTFEETPKPTLIEGLAESRLARANVIGDSGLVAKTRQTPEQLEQAKIEAYREKVASGDIPPTEIDQKLVVGLLFSGTEIQYYSDVLGYWIDYMGIDDMRISQIRTRSFRVKPVEFEYYGVKLPKPIDPRSTREGVYGISFVNRKVYPCSNGVARTNVGNKQGHYWATKEQAELVLATILKPFLDSESK